MQPTTDSAAKKRRKKDEPDSQLKVDTPKPKGTEEDGEDKREKKKKKKEKGSKGYVFVHQLVLTLFRQSVRLFVPNKYVERRRAVSIAQAIIESIEQVGKYLV